MEVFSLIVAPVVAPDVALISMDHAGRDDSVRGESPQPTVGELAAHALHVPARGGLAQEGPHDGRRHLALLSALLLLLKKDFCYIMLFIFSHLSYWIKIKDLFFYVTHLLSHFFILNQVPHPKRIK